ncbi:MAG TPA: cytochrome P450 [Caulobacteraceae bacterium]|nr:cytochrome P450 [Caulobacteraceae bacterium]
MSPADGVGAQGKGPPAFRELARDGEREAFMARLGQGDRPFRDAEGSWVVSRFEEARAILLDPARFSSRDSDGEGFPLLRDDPPRHTALRGLLQKAFTRGRVEAMRPEIEVIARDLAAAIRPGEETDIVAAITSPLPVMVIARMLGVAEGDRDKFRDWSNRFVGATELVEEAHMLALMEMSQYLGVELARRRVAPGDDLISALARAEEAGVTLSDKEIISLSVLLLVAGNETTTNLFSNMMSHLAGRPEHWRALREDPALIEGAVEEILRVDSPVQFTVRVALADVQVGGVEIRAGETVFVYLALANRDPALWPDAGALDIRRGRAANLAFGFGVHLCIGAPLARLEARAGLAALLERFETVRFGEGSRPRTAAALLRGFQRLPLIFA